MQTLMKQGEALGSLAQQIDTSYRCHEEQFSEQIDTSSHRPAEQCFEQIDINKRRTKMDEKMTKSANLGELSDELREFQAKRLD